ncbi:flagellar protein FlaG [Nitrosomonas sp.]|uniref:flagellar protein FlaG n=1 Tax=Nitrosomonas sp. TaxID=42353 RepID=UPI0025D0ABDC|nr:flagellar protein FlaG [Nitrosomonas sp.]MBY0483158.1 flagellar protein FlaG [Nitrosomonas sp.]MDO9311377.1 flagellar protein FlaG [Nitrosomonas sp.]
MNINQLNGTGVLPVPSSTSSVAKKVSAPDTDIIPLPVSTVRPKVDNKTESDEQIRQAVQNIQGAVDNLAHNLRFSIDEDTGKTIIKVVDTHTDEVIRQFPTEQAIEIARTLDKVQGLLFNDKA